MNRWKNDKFSICWFVSKSRKVYRLQRSHGWKNLESNLWRELFCVSLLFICCEIYWNSFKCVQVKYFILCKSNLYRLCILKLNCFSFLFDKKYYDMWFHKSSYFINLIINFLFYSLLLLTWYKVNFVEIYMIQFTFRTN